MQIKRWEIILLRYYLSNTMPGHRLKLKHFKLLHWSKSMNNKIKKHEREFIEAVAEDDMELLKKLTKDKINVMAPILWNCEYVYPIHIGCALGSLNVVKYLFRIGCILETETESGMTPLHFSSAYNNNHPEVTEHLLDMGARVNVKDNLRGYTPFHYAAENNNFGAAKRLLQVTSKFPTDNEGHTAKDVAIENDCDQIESLLEKFDEDYKHKQELKTLPSRIGKLEKKTDFLLQQHRLYSCGGDSAVYGLDADMPCSSDHIFFNKDFDVGAHMRSVSSLPAFQRASLRRKKVKSLTVSENQMQIINTLAPPLSRAANSISPICKDFPGCPYDPGESLETTLTRESPISKLHRHQIVRHYSLLLSMIKPEKLIIKLFSKNYFDLEAKERLDKMSTQQEKVDFILTNYLLKGSMGLYEDFLQSLRDCNMEHLAETLDKVPLFRSSSSSSDSIDPHIVATSKQTDV